MKSKLPVPEAKPEDLAAELARIKESTDVAWLNQRLISAVATTVEGLMTLSWTARRLQELGEDLADYNFSIPPIYLKIAYGQVRADLVVRLLGQPKLLERAAALPLPDQERVARDEPLKVMEPGGDHRLIPASKLTRREIRLVFARDKIRDEAEQASWLRENPLHPAARSAEEEPVFVDRHRRVLVVGKHCFTAAELSHFLSQLTADIKPRAR